MRVAIVENTAVTHHGAVGVALHEAAARVVQFRPWLDGALPEAADFDAVVVFGGEQSALSDQSHPYLPALARRMAAFSQADKAVLGICLGAQLLARGFGGQNHLGAAAEFGWCPVQTTEAGRADPVLASVPGDFAIFQWHADTFTLPQAAQHLATSAAAANQSFRLGRATYGMQFHFEANRAMVADWVRNFPTAIGTFAPGWLALYPTHEARHGADADRHGIALARAFVALI